MDGLVIVLLALTGWVLLLYVLEKRGLLARLGLALMGPFLMWKTTRGRDLIERIARWPRWDVVGSAFVVLTAVTMVGMTALLVWSATLVPAIPAERAPSPQMLLGIPGINPIIPIGYGILALAVAIVVHEVSHGILARRWKVGIQSLGLLFFIVPIGAFVEPDEEGMRALDRRKRGAVYAAGPGSNMVLAVGLALLFALSMASSVEARAPGMGITGIVDGSPAESTLETGMIITAIDGAPVTTAGEFTAALGDRSVGETVTLTLFAGGASLERQVTLADRFDFTGEDADRGSGFLGVTTITTSPDVFNPVAASQRMGWGAALFLFLVLPFQRLMPVQAPLTEFYTVTGGWALLPEPVFWVLANVVYWLFWINLMLGMTNALPAVPLDGGYLFRDWVVAGVAKLRRGMALEARERVARNLSYAIALFILALILWQLVGPRL